MWGIRCTELQNQSIHLRLLNVLAVFLDVQYRTALVASRGIFAPAKFLSLLPIIQEAAEALGFELDPETGGGLRGEELASVLEQYGDSLAEQVSTPAAADKPERLDERKWQHACHSKGHIPCSPEVGNCRDIK